MTDRRGALGGFADSRAIRRVLLITLAISLVVGAVLISIDILSGTHDVRLVLIALSSAGFCLLALTSSIGGDDRPWSPGLSALGTATCVVGLAVTVAVLLSPHPSKGLVKALGVTIVVPFDLAYSALLLLAYGKKRAVNAVALIAVGLAAVFTAFSIVQILSARNLSSGTYKAWGIVGIFGIVSSVVTPILSTVLADD